MTSGKYFVKIKESEIDDLPFAKKAGFDSNMKCEVMGTISDKLLVVHPNNGKLLELFPRKCTVVY